jgi:predicted DsbA family dithiol-disulfide isomerase
MAEAIKFYFDPICPWCYMTSRWIYRLEELGEVELSWGVFSLEIVNKGKESAEMEAAHARSGLALRTAVKVREEEGEAAIGAFYKALGHRIHEKVEPLQEMDTVMEALSDAGLDVGWAEKAEADPATWDAVVAEHNTLVEDTRSFGVPTIQLDGGEGLAIFGPVISKMPATDEESRELLGHVLWLARYGNFSELKRHRAEPADTESVRYWRKLREEQRKREES